MLRTASRDCILNPEYRRLQWMHWFGTVELAHLSRSICIILISDNTEISYVTKYVGHNCVAMCH